MKNKHILSNKMKKNHRKIGERIREIRKEKGLTQIEFSKILGITQDKLSKYETGRVGVPIEIILKISDEFKISLDWLLKGKGPKISKKTYEFDEEIYKIAQNLQILKEDSPEWYEKVKKTISAWLKE
jgi:transcriptional regulator with XRE-family HTH domain